MLSICGIQAIYIFECTEIEPNVCNVTGTYSTSDYPGVQITKNLTEWRRLKINNSESFKNVTKVIIDSFGLDPFPNRICDTLPLLKELMYVNTKRTLFVEEIDAQTIFEKKAYGKFNCDYLETLDLSRNNFKHFLIKDINATSVLTLNLSMNHLTDIDLPAIFNEFPKLKTLDLAGNKFHCSRIESMIDQLKAKRIKFTSTSNRIDCVNTTIWADLVEKPEYFTNENKKKVASLELLKSILNIVEDTKHHLSKIIDQVKSNLEKYKNENEADLTRIETSFAQANTQSNMQYQELKLKFASYMESTSQELASLNRLLYFCFALLIAFIIAITANIFKESCRLKKISQKPSQTMSQPLVEIR